MGNERVRPLKQQLLTGPKVGNATRLALGQMEAFTGVGDIQAWIRQEERGRAVLDHGTQQVRGRAGGPNGAMCSTDGPRAGGNERQQYGGGRVRERARPGSDNVIGGEASVVVPGVDQEVAVAHGSTW